MKQRYKNTKVMKFGGTSVGSPNSIRQLIDIVSSSDQPVAAVVVSAFSKVTNYLIEAAELASKGDTKYKKLVLELEKRHEDAAKELITDQIARRSTLKYIRQTFAELNNVLQGVYLIKELSPKILDTIMSYGERLSAFVIAQSFQSKGKEAEFIDARKLVKTDNTFGSAHVDLNDTYQAISSHFKALNGSIKVVTGFIGATEQGETTTLGRGGSDYSASIFGAALQVSDIEIWTDVDGVLTADPHKVPSAFTLSHMTYQEAMEMSHFGAKVIYPPTMLPAMAHKIPLVIRNTFNPDFPGTKVGTETANSYLIKGISSIENIALLMLQGSGMRGTPNTVARLFGSLAKYAINIILITQASSEYTICFAIEPKYALKAKAVIEEEFAHEIKAKLIDPVVIEEDLSIIAVVGDQMRKTYGLAGKVFTTLAQEKINVVAIAQGSSERNLSFVVNRQDEAKAITILHKVFFEQKQFKQVSLYLVGAGLIGSTLLEQINALKLIVQKEKISLQIVAIANQKKMVFNEEGIDLSSWKEALNTGQRMDLTVFMQTVQQARKDAIFVDCTASEELTKWYPKLLESGIAVVTPNKKANSGSLELYQAIRQAEEKAQTFFMYETNVCAGLPIIQTIQDLVATGDEIYRIEGVLSGTLSYIFNNFFGKKTMSTVVKEARKRGYTEPDPRDDLNGLDVGRKLLILAREAGLKLDLTDIAIENLVPSACRNAGTVDAFLTQLSACDGTFEELKQEAVKQKKRLRYIARIDMKKKLLSCRLEMVDAEHPFYALSGSDNIVMLTTKRYNKTPMVIKGPGAGAEVTADGVLADILQIGKYYAYEK